MSKSDLLNRPVDLRDLITCSVISLLRLLDYLLVHKKDKQLYLWCFISKKMNKDSKDYRKAQFFGWKNNSNAEENVQWSLLQLLMDTLSLPYHGNHVQIYFLLYK